VRFEFKTTQIQDVINCHQLIINCPIKLQAGVFSTLAGFWVQKLAGLKITATMIG